MQHNSSRIPVVLTIAGVLLSACLVGKLQAVSQSIYYISADGQQIRRADTNGANNTLLVQLATGAFNGINGGASAQQITVDPEDGIFWTDFWHDRVRHANLDGSNLSDVILTGNSENIQIDPIANKIYWTEWPHGGAGTARTLRRSDLNGANSEIVIDNMSNAGPSLLSAVSLGSSFAIDYNTQRIYYLDNGDIRRVNYDGTGDQLYLVAQPGGIGTLEVDSWNHELFYSPTAIGQPPSYVQDPSAEQVFRVNLLTGSAPSLIYDFNIVFNNRSVLGIGLDYHRTRAYMVDQHDFNIGSVRYDGTASASPSSFTGLKAFDLLAIPEPTTLLLSVAGGVLLIRRRIR